MVVIANYIILLFGLSFWGNSYSQTEGVEKLPPVLNYVPENELMGLIESEFTLQAVGRKIPTNERDANRDYTNLKSTYKDLLAKADEESIESFTKAFESALKIYAYYVSTDYLGNAKGKINQLREMIYKMGEWVYLKQTDPKKREFIQILYLAHGLGQPAYLSDSISKIIEKEKNAPKDFFNSIKLLLFYNLNSSPSTASSAKMILDQLSGKLTDRQKVIVDLIGIESRIAIDDDDEDVQENPAAITKELLAASKKAQLIKEAGLRWRVNSTILYMWLRINKNPDWREAPLIEIQSKTGVVITPVLERIVIEDVSSGNLPKGIQTYKSLSQAFRNQPISIQLDARYLELSTRYMAVTTNYEFLDSVYRELVNRYDSQGGRFKKIAKQAGAQFFREYIMFLQSLLDKSLVKNADYKLKMRTVDLVEKFIKSYSASKRSQIIQIKVSIAQLYQNLGKNKEAVAEYLDLTKEDPIRFYQMASVAQKTLAAWPDLPPWGKIPRGDRGERLTLASIYEAIVKIQKEKEGKPKWVDLAHLGLLYGSTGQLSKAEELWAPHITKATPSPHTNGASGILLANYFKQKRWTEFIELARVAEERKILPTLEQQVLDMKKFYKIALIQRSQMSVKSSNWKLAITDYQEVVDRYPKDANRPVLIVEIARLYQRDKNISKAMDTVQSLVGEYPNSPQSKMALLEAGSWGKESKDPKILGQASDFYRIYVESFTNDPGVPTARFERAKVLIKLSQFPLASQYLRDHAMDSRVSAPDRVRAALMHISLEDKYGEQERAIASLVPVIRMVQPNFGEDLYVSAHVILARVGTEKVNIQEMKTEEKILNPYINRRLDVADVLGYLRLTMANHFEYEIPFPNQPQGIDTYKPAVDTIFKAFKTIQSSYEGVCLPRENRYCEQAYGRLKQFSQDTVDALSAVELGGQVQAKMVKVLQEYRQATLRKVTAEKQKFDQSYDRYRIANERKEFK